MKNLLTTIILVFILFSTSSIIYTNVNAGSEPYLEDISDFYLTSQKLTSTKGSTLIPKGSIQGVNDVYFVEYQYELLIKDGSDLNTSIRNLSMSNSEMENELINQVFDFDFSYEILETIDYHEDLFGEGVEANRVLVTLTISMNEPASYEIYQMVAGNQLSFESYFYVA